MGKFTEQLSEAAQWDDSPSELLNEAVDIIDEMETVLRKSLKYVAIFESENFDNEALSILTLGDKALVRLK